MNDQDIMNILRLVTQMRGAQMGYFTTMAKAKKSRLSEDFEQAKNLLMESKRLEAECDRAIAEWTKIVKP